MLSYTIWYVAVRQIGSARTAAYSNLIPVVAMASAVLFLGEPTELRKVLGAAAVLAGVALTRAGGWRRLQRSESRATRRNAGRGSEDNGDTGFQTEQRSNGENWKVKGLTSHFPRSAAASGRRSDD